jgi:virginiamycin B lyase
VVGLACGSLCGSALAGRNGVLGRTLLGAAVVLLVLAFAPGAGARVYWGNYNNGTFGRANLDGTGVDQSFILAAPGATPYGVAVDGAHVYWINYTPNSIGRANLDGSGVDPNFIPTGTVGSDGLAVDAGHIYWANVNAGTIGRANLDGTDVNQSFITGASGPSGPAVDGAHIYWANGNGTIGRADLDGAGANESFITGSISSQPLQMALDAGHIYWANYGSGTTIGRAELNGTDVNQSFISGASGASGVGVDGAHIYWANYNGATIGRANLDGTDVNQSFVTGGNGPWYLAVAPLDTTINAAPSGTVASSTASFSFSGSEPGAFQCQVDGGGFSNCTSPASYSGLAVGAHSFAVRATNASGDIDPTPATSAWTVSAPVAPGVFGARTLVTLKLASGHIRARGPITVRIANANGFSINGKLSGRTVDRVSVVGKRRLALRAKAFRVGAHAKKTIKLNIPRTLQGVLKRHHKLRLRLAATVRDPAGHARTVTKAVSLRLRNKHPHTH